MEYRVISGTSVGQLESLVNNEIENGFIPIGGVSYDPFLCEYIQAVLKKH